MIRWPCARDTGRKFKAYAEPIRGMGGLRFRGGEQSGRHLGGVALLRMSRSAQSHAMGRVERVRVSSAVSRVSGKRPGTSDPLASKPARSATRRGLANQRALD